MMDPAVTALADTVVPGGGLWPSASEAGVASRISDAATSVLDRLGDDFPTSTAEDREALLRALEVEDPDAVGRVVEAVYTAYYTSPEVATVLESTVGYPARPPQPEGYELAPFDLAILDVVRRSAANYRMVD